VSSDFLPRLHYLRLSILNNGIIIIIAVVMPINLSFSKIEILAIYIPIPILAALSREMQQFILLVKNS